MNYSSVEDALLPHLFDIASDPASAGLILAGGLGIQIKRQYLRDMKAQTLIAFDTLPAVRPTQDIDFFLLIELFMTPEQGIATRSLLDKLAYQEYTPKWQFDKPLGPGFPAQSKVIVDLLARSPRAEENVKFDSRRVGKASGTGLHGRHTPEAFAVEDAPLQLSVKGRKTNGDDTQANIFVPHVYAWINMKIMAAYDWFQAQGTEKAKPDSAKHAFDVYMLTAMLTEQEIATADMLAQKYARHPIAEQIKNYACVLYETPAAPGFREAQRQAGRPIEHDVFWQGVCAVLGIAP